MYDLFIPLNYLSSIVELVSANLVNSIHLSRSYIYDSSYSIIVQLMFVFANVKLITIAIKTKIKIYQIYLIMKIKAFYSLFSLIILNYLFISYNNIINIKLI